MNQQDARALVRGMVAIPSFSGQEQAVAAYIVTAMEQLGFRSEIDGAGNAVGVRGNPSGPMVLMLGHMDTVPGEIPVRQEGSLLYGRGSVDAKGSLATMIAAAAQMDVSAAQVVVVGAVEEETPGSRGAHYIRESYHPDAVIIAEPSGWQSVGVGYKGRMGIEFRVARPLSHPAGLGEKATEVAFRFWNRLTVQLEQIGAGKSVFHRPIATLCEFSGDLEQARLYISCRTPLDFDIGAFEDWLDTIRGDAQLTIDERTPAIFMERTAPVVRALTTSIRRHGGKPSFKVKSGTSDMNIVGQRWQVPMAAYGPGDSSLDHTPDEHLDLNEYQRAIDVLGDALPLLVAQLREGQSADLPTDETLSRDVATASDKRIKHDGS